MSIETRSLPVKLSNDEFTSRSEELARQIAKWDDIDTERKAQASDFKGKLETVEGAIKSLARVVRDRTEYREIRVYERRNDIALTMELIRDDTGEVVESRPLLKAELQAELFHVAGGKKKKSGSGEGEGN